MFSAIKPLIIAAALSIAPLSVINSDTFTDTNGTSLDAHTMTSGGQTWNEIGSSVWEIQSNKVVQNGASAWMFASVESSDASVLVEADIAVPSANDVVAGLVVRFTDSSNYWLVDIIRQSGGNYRMRIVENNATTETARDEDTNVGSIGGTTVNVTVTANGNTITGYLNDVQKVTYASASFNNTETKHGLGQFSGSPYDLTTTWDNFSIDSDPTFGGGGGPTLNPSIINAPIRGGGIFRAVADYLFVRPERKVARVHTR